MRKRLLHAVTAVVIGVTGGILTATSYVVISAISAAGTGQGSTLFSIVAEEETNVETLHAAASSNPTSAALQHPILLLILISSVIAVCAFAVMRSQEKYSAGLLGGMFKKT